MPNFKFISERDRNRIYSNIIEEISGNFCIEDKTDFNYESCYSFSIKNKRTFICGLALSLVGPYAYMGRRGREKFIIVNKDDCINQYEEKILNIITSHKITMLSLNDLKTKLPIKIVDSDFEEGESNIVFNLLFYRDRLSEYDI